MRRSAAGGPILFGCAAYFMVHGSTGYFSERARFERRVSLLTLAVGMFFMAALLGAGLPGVRRLIERTTERFGFEGPTQYVRRITLEQYRGAPEPLRAVGPVRPVVARKGGDPIRSRSQGPNARPETRSRVRGPGAAEADLVARSVSRIANVPIIRSEELVIDRLVRPSYPAELLDRNVEGRVTLQALIDTTGRVRDVQVLASSGEFQFEHAAESAVWQCRFRPYRQRGVPSEVYAVFRFAFRIY